MLSEAQSRHRNCSLKTDVTAILVCTGHYLPYARRSGSASSARRELSLIFCPRRFQSLLMWRTCWSRLRWRPPRVVAVSTSRWSYSAWTFQAACASASRCLLCSVSKVYFAFGFQAYNQNLSCIAKNDKIVRFFHYKVRTVRTCKNMPHKRCYLYIIWRCSSAYLCVCMHSCTHFLAFLTTGQLKTGYLADWTFHQLVSRCYANFNN